MCRRGKRTVWESVQMWAARHSFRSTLEIGKARGSRSKFSLTNAAPLLDLGHPGSGPGLSQGQTRKGEQAVLQQPQEGGLVAICGSWLRPVPDAHVLIPSVSVIKRLWCVCVRARTCAFVLR